ncbi:MAG TPA: hypothetical protein VEO19_00215 [Terriglobia bacterium]|nr:hypothetical protein [Terriglobia bacterium]
MRYLHRKPVPRAVATALILFAQLQLLWLAAVHCHDLPLVPQSAKFQPINPTQKPASAVADIQCPACSLIHQSITLVSPEFSAPQPSAAQRYRLSAAPVRTLTGDLPVPRGRAPPLS